MTNLTRRFINGEEGAFEEIYAMLSPRLKLTAYRFCRNSETAMDVVQDIFAKLAAMDIPARIEHFGGEHANIEGWLMVGVKHRAMDIVKIETNRRKKGQDVLYTFEDQTNSLSEEHITHERFSQMCEKLQPRQREVMTLHIQGFRNEEIAARLDLTYNTVKNIIYEARLRLKELWLKYMV
jgi:RNA polymerase sigma factor (sigma-70 family)